MDPSGVGALVTGGGVVSLVVALVYVGRLALDWWAKRGEERRADRSEGATAVATAAETNAILLASLKDERDDNQANAAEIAELRAQNSHQYQQMREMRRDHEREIAELREEHQREITQLRSDYEHEVTQLEERLQELTAEVAALRERFHPKDEP